MKYLSEFPDIEGYVSGRDPFVGELEFSKFSTDIIVACSTIEHSRAQAFCLTMGAGIEVAMAVYDTLKTPEVRKIALLKAAEVGMRSEDYNVLSNIEKRSEPVFQIRNRLAHSIWGKCDSIPDSILLIPDRLSRKDRLLSFPNRPTVILGVPNNKVEVYSKTELSEAASRAWECAGLYHDLYWCFSYRAQRDERQVEQKPSRSAQASAFIYDVEKSMDETYGQLWDKLKRI